jgi:hypothetical protein
LPAERSQPKATGCLGVSGDQPKLDRKPVATMRRPPPSLVINEGADFQKPPVCYGLCCCFSNCCGLSLCTRARAVGAFILFIVLGMVIGMQVLVTYVADQSRIKANRFKWEGAFIPICIFSFCSSMLLFKLIFEQIKQPFLCQKLDEALEKSREEQRMMLAGQRSGAF